MAAADCDKPRECPLGSTTAAEWGRFMAEHERVMHALFADNGETGLLAMFRAWMLEQQVERRMIAAQLAAKAADDLRKDHRVNRNNFLVNILMVLLTLAMAAVAILEFNRQTQEHILNLPQVFHSHSIDPTVAEKTPLNASR